MKPREPKEDVWGRCGCATHCTAVLQWLRGRMVSPPACMAVPWRTTTALFSWPKRVFSRILMEDIRIAATTSWPWRKTTTRGTTWFVPQTNTVLSIQFTILLVSELLIFQFTSAVSKLNLVISSSSINLWLSFSFHSLSLFHICSHFFCLILLI